jgi:hypothetical protein
VIAPTKIQPSETFEIITAWPFSRKKATVVLPILLKSPHRPQLTISFSTFSQSSVSEPPSQFNAQINAQIDPITATTPFDSQDPDLQPIAQQPLGQKYNKPSVDVSEESRGSKSEDSEKPDNIDTEDRDLEDYDIIFQNLSMIDATAADLNNLT